MHIITTWLSLTQSQTEVHNLGVSKSIKAEQVNKFFTTAVSGKRSPDSEWCHIHQPRMASDHHHSTDKMEWVSWPPKYPAIKFPSTEFTNTITIKEKSSEKKKVVDEDDQGLKKETFYGDTMSHSLSGLLFPLTAVVKNLFTCSALIDLETPRLCTSVCDWVRDSHVVIICMSANTNICKV